MKKQNQIPAYIASAMLVLSLTTIPAHAALTKVAAPAAAEQAIEDDTITPEASSASSDDVAVANRSNQPRVVVNKTTVVQEQVAQQAPEATRPSAGQQLDQGMRTKMGDVQGQFEKALLESMEHIKVTVTDDRANPAPGQAQVVQDDLTGHQAAPEKADYIGVNDAPKIKGDELAAGGESVDSLKEEKRNERKFHVNPVFGKTMINSDMYAIDARYTAGFELEMDLDKMFSMVLGYSYSQYSIGLATANPFYGYGNGNGLSTLAYNQNLFEIGGRVYLMPKESKFRIFGGAGIGYNMGYLNYNQNQYVSNVAYNPYYNYGTSDYEVKSWLGILSAGMQLNVSESVALGALFKYAMVFSSSQNQSLNNYGFVPNGQQYGTNTNQAVVGGSLQNASFYSILGTVKVSF